jgi:hypothetical protein
MDSRAAMPAPATTCRTSCPPVRSSKGSTMITTPSETAIVQRANATPTALHRLLAAAGTILLLLLAGCGTTPPPIANDPAAPTNVRAESGDGSVTLAWDANGDASISRYNILQGHDDGTLAKIGETRQTSYTIGGLVNGQSYVFAVEAENASGRRSPRAAGSSVTATPIEAPKSDPTPKPDPDPIPPPLPVVDIGALETRCIMRWHDSHQVHSISWGRVRMKKLEHCIELTLTGPLNIQNVAKSFVDTCVKEGLRKDAVANAISLLAALGADLLGGGGAVTAARLAEYVRAAGTEIMGCLTDTGRIEKHIGDQLRDRFQASVRKRSHWVYWNL